MPTAMSRKKAIDMDPEYLPKAKALTIEQLLQKNGDPIWIVTFSSAHQKIRMQKWVLMRVLPEIGVQLTDISGYRYEKLFKQYGKTWLAFAGKPEEGD